MVERGWDHTRGHQPADVGDVREQVCFGGVADPAHARVVYQPRVGRRPSNDELRAIQPRVLLHAVVVNEPSGLVQSVRKGIEEHRHCGYLLGVGLVAMAEVAPVREVQSHDAVVRRQDRGVCLEVSGGAGQGLHIHAPPRRV